MKKIFNILLLVLLLFPAPLLGASPIHITSDSMVVERDKGIVTFRGNVVAKRDDLIINAEELKVFYNDKREIERIEAIGKVRIDREGSTAFGEKAEFFNREEKLILTGSPRVVEGLNSVEGDRITLYLKEGRSIVEGGKDRRVKAVFVPQEKEGGKKK